MAKLEDRGPRGLPPPPAPTRRSANPWRFSDSARKPSPQEEEAASRLLEDLLVGHPPETARDAPVPAPAPAARPRQRALATPRRSGFLPLLALLLIGGVIARIAMGARETGEWRQLIPALFIVFFIAQAWLRSRKRRDERDDGDDGR